MLECSSARVSQRLSQVPRAKGFHGEPIGQVRIFHRTHDHCVCGQECGHGEFNKVSIGKRVVPSESDDHVVIVENARDFDEATADIEQVSAKDLNTSLSRTIRKEVVRRSVRCGENDGMSAIHSPQSSEWRRLDTAEAKESLFWQP
jgi:hypothetical protein